MTDRPAFTRLSEDGGGEAIIRRILFTDLARLAEPTLEAGVAAVLIKLGGRGAYLRTGPKGLPGRGGWANRELYSPVFSIPHVAGTTGAGDTTISGFLASITRNLEPEQALTMAEAVGACCVEALDATSGIRSWEETVARVQAGWRHGPAVVEEPGWKQMPSGIWSGPNDAVGGC